jgi:hypothetical protein
MAKPLQLIRIYQRRDARLHICEAVGVSFFLIIAVIAASFSLATSHKMFAVSPEGAGAGPGPTFLDPPEHALRRASCAAIHNRSL